MAKIFGRQKTQRKGRLQNRLTELKCLPRDAALVRFLDARHKLSAGPTVPIVELAGIIHTYYPQATGDNDALTLMNFARRVMTRLDTRKES